jgi:hypothetical protein
MLSWPIWNSHIEDFVAIHKITSKDFSALKAPRKVQNLPFPTLPPFDSYGWNQYFIEASSPVYNGLAFIYSVSRNLSLLVL